jgi:hypothetical protein
MPMNDDIEPPTLIMFLDEQMDMNAALRRRLRLPPLPKDQSQTVYRLGPEEITADMAYLPEPVSVDNYIMFIDATTKGGTHFRIALPERVIRAIAEVYKTRSRV